MKQILIFLLSMAAVVVSAQNSVYTQRPEDGNAIYFEHRKGDVSDALQEAINRVSREKSYGILFIAPGTYEISRTIYVPRAVRLIGWGEKRPEIVLAANSPGFQQERPNDKGKANYMIWFTSSISTDERVSDASPSTFYSCLSNINLRIGKGNPWAVALRTHYAQHSFIAHADIHAENGRAGLFEMGNEMENVRFFGGEWGIYTTKASPGWPVMMTDVYFEGQRRAAIRSQEGGLAIVRMTARNVPAVIEIEENYSDKLFLEDCVFENVSKHALLIALEDNANNQISLRNVVCRNVPTLAVSRKGNVFARSEGAIYKVRSFDYGLKVDDPGAEPVYRTDYDATPLGKMPAPFAKDIPAIPSMKTWVNVKEFGAVGDGETDDTAALQKAIASAKNIYIPDGHYVVSETITLKPETNLIALHPFATQLVLKESTPAFSGFGAPKALLETPRGGTNIVTGLGIDTGAYNYRAVGVKWQAGEKSYMNDVKLVGGHGGMTRPKPGETVPEWRARTPQVSSPENPVTAPGKDMAWDTQHWSLWITNGGGGTFKNIWTASTYAASGLLVTDTETPGRIYAMSLEHHVRNEARFRNVKNWKAYAFQFEEESREGQFCLPLELDNCENIRIANLYMFQVIRVNTVFPYAVRTWNCRNIEFLNLHNYAQTKHSTVNALYDINADLTVRPWEIQKLTVKGGAPERRDDVGRMERLATGFEFAQGLSSDSKGNIYFCEQRMRRVYKWSPKEGLSLIADFPWEPFSTAVDTEDNLIVVFRYAPQPGTNEKPETYPDSRGTSFAGYGNNNYTTMAYTIDPNDPEESIRLLDRDELTSDLICKALYPSNRWRDFHDFNEVVDYSPATRWIAPDGMTVIPNQYDLARSLQLLEATPGKPFYTSDEYDKRMVRLSVDETGGLSDMEYFVEAGEFGSAVDAAGNLYVADGQVQIFNPRGERIGQIDVPERPLTLVFSKNDQGMLYITSHTSLYRVRVDIPLELPAGAARNGFWPQRKELVQLDNDAQKEWVVLFSADNGHYPAFDIFRTYLAVVDGETGHLEYLSPVGRTTSRDIVVEDGKLVRRYMKDGKFTVDEKGNNLQAEWIVDRLDLEKLPVVLGYVTSWSTSMPDPTLLTHINYAFGHVNETFDGVTVGNPERLREIVGLREKNPDLKILLSIGGWGSGRFSEMAADAKLRRSFADDARRVADEFGLDGIDIDWEYPTSDAANISASPEDTKNFSLLMRDLREALGTEKLLTLATVWSGEYIDFRAIEQDVDLVNMMTYDMDHTGRAHHSALYRSERSGGGTSHEATEKHLAAGVPTSKLVMGVPFYGRGVPALKGFTNYRRIIELEGYERRWDEVAQSPYLVDGEGNMVIGYDDERSLKAKMKYIDDRGLRGVMYWDFAGDDDNLTLSKTIAR